MQRRTLMKQSLFATLLLSVAAAAFAGGGGGAAGSGRNQYPRPISASSPQPVAQSAVSAAAANTGSSPASSDWAPAAEGSAGVGKTRAQVRAELLQAEEAGLIPTLNAEYPPGADTIARNRAHFRQTEQAWRGGSQADVAAR